MRRHGKPFKELVNHYLRVGLNTRQPAKPRKFVVHAAPWGYGRDCRWTAFPRSWNNSKGPSPAPYSPAFFHNSSTLLFTSPDISITPGHGRVNPSPGHFRVASIPIFDP